MPASAALSSESPQADRQRRRRVGAVGRPSADAPPAARRSAPARRQEIAIIRSIGTRARSAIVGGHLHLVHEVAQARRAASAA